MEKIDYKHGRFNILTTDILTMDNKEGYASYCDCCEGMEKEPAEYGSEEFLRWCYDEVNVNYECDMENIENEERYCVPVVIEGTLRLWHGGVDIVPEECDSVAEAIKKCIGRDIEDIDVFWDNGKIEVIARHHDGSNCFTIRLKDKRRKLPYLYA